MSKPAGKGRPVQPATQKAVSAGPRQTNSTESARTLNGTGAEKHGIVLEGKGQNEAKEMDLESSDNKANKNAPSQPEIQKENQAQVKKDPYLVTLDGREHINPHTWKVSYRWLLTMLGGQLVLNVAFTSTGPSQLIPAIQTYFGVSSEVGTLTISVFVAGFCIGPLLWG